MHINVEKTTVAKIPQTVLDLPSKLGVGARVRLWDIAAMPILEGTQGTVRFA